MYILGKQFKKEVFCTLQVEGIHSWPECPFDEVAYLRDPHRHIFHIKGYKVVTHDDRDVEFIMLKRQLVEYLIFKYADRDNENPFICMFGPMSCEMIAKELIEEFDLSKCEVSEDNENGTVVTVTGENK